MEIYITFKIYQNSTQYDIHNNDTRSRLERQTQKQEAKGSGWIFHKT